MKNCFGSFLLLIILNSSLWAQDFAYVTDALQLRVYSRPSGDSEVLQIIDSGDSVEVFVTQDGISKVTTYDGTEGWEKSAFLVEEPPDKLLYYSVSEKNKELELEIESLKNGIRSNSEITSADSEEQIKNLETALQHQQQTNQALLKQLEENSATNLEQTTKVSNQSVVDKQVMQIPDNKKLWLLGFAAVLLLAGILLGMKLSSWRMKKRLHGFRFK